MLDIVDMMFHIAPIIYADMRFNTIEWNHVQVSSPLISNVYDVMSDDEKISSIAMSFINCHMYIGRDGHLLQQNVIYDSLINYVNQNIEYNQFDDLEILNANIDDCINQIINSMSVILYIPLEFRHDNTPKIVIF